MTTTSVDLDAAVDLTRTGDIWLFRGTSTADRAIRMTTNSPVNHVGMSVVLDDLPPLMWHAELGKGLPDMWTGTHQRGVQLHNLRDAVLQWAHRYGQRGWLRQLNEPVTPEMEEGLLRAIARLDGTPFPSTGRLLGHWVQGRMPRRRRRGGEPEPDGERARLESAYCAQVVALTYQMMGLLSDRKRHNYYDPGRFWSGDTLELTDGYRLGGEIEIRIPPAAG